MSLAHAAAWGHIMRVGEGKPAKAVVAPCQSGSACGDHRRLRTLHLREAAKNGDMAFDPSRRQANRLLPPGQDGHAQPVPRSSTFWQDKRKQELQEQNQPE
ncbi:hypothetical protein [Chromobacterium sp. IIBBL 290-4]|uniref:hypothetical protein n=1 Tax=Chromobacterium sp. IIBBL 290-4 TaxID=2953890 RepID=UPI0020B65F11|nr:hypothetical protein [Chromobacterium sp. IIBBL 290-4]UTH75888.1 hypothetical protein NKT35_07225 [Chromobacterium sp. IIBBL 290-4]